MTYHESLCASSVLYLLQIQGSVLPRENLVDWE